MLILLGSLKHIFIELVISHSFWPLGSFIYSVGFKCRDCRCFIPPRMHLVLYCLFTLNPFQEAFPCLRGVLKSLKFSKASPVIDLQGHRVLIQKPLFWFTNINDSFQGIIKSQFVVQQLTFGCWSIFMWHFNSALHLHCNLLDLLCCGVLKSKSQRLKFAQTKLKLLDTFQLPFHFGVLMGK